MSPGAASYLICCVQRTGSWLLAHTLRDLEIAGRPSDYFDDAERQTHSVDWQVGSFDTYLEAVRQKATTANGVFGSKMMWNDFVRFRGELRVDNSLELTDAELLARTFPGLRYIWLRRHDKIRQGISWWRAVVTNQWALLPEEAARRDDLDVENILNLVRFATECEEGWRRWFTEQHIIPLEVLYEQLTEDRLEVTNRVLAHLGLPLVDDEALPRPRYRQQADEVTEHYVGLIRQALNQ